jgi:Lytic transglycolase
VGRPGATSALLGYPPADVRRPRFVASVALIAALVTVAVPASVGSRSPSSPVSPGNDLFRPVEAAFATQGSVTAISQLDPSARSAGALAIDQPLIEPTQRSGPEPARPRAAQPAATPGSVTKNPWRHDPEISWYGPGFYGHGTACGQKLTMTLLGVAHRTLPCGTMVTFRNAATGQTITVPVVDRGPYVSGRIFDLTRATCKAIGHCFTGPIEYRIGGG